MKKLNLLVWLVCFMPRLMYGDVPDQVEFKPGEKFNLDNTSSQLDLGGADFLYCKFIDAVGIEFNAFVEPGFPLDIPKGKIKIKASTNPVNSLSSWYSLNVESKKSDTDFPKKKIFKMNYDMKNKLTLLVAQN